MKKHQGSISKILSKQSVSINDLLIRSSVSELLEHLGDGIRDVREIVVILGYESGAIGVSQNVSQERALFLLERAKIRMVGIQTYIEYGFYDEDEEE